MDVHPSFGVNPPGPTPIEPFASNALYEILIDTDGDAIVNIAYSVKINGRTRRTSCDAAPDRRR
jgi:hypothetical protein